MSDGQGSAAAVRLRVLLVDDHPSLLKALTRLVGQACDVVGACRTGMEALETAGRLRPDVMVVDVHLPDVDGLDVCRIAAVTARTAVVILTGADDPAIARQALEAGATAVVLKHRLGDDLLPAIAAATRR